MTAFSTCLLFNSLMLWAGYSTFIIPGNIQVVSAEPLGPPVGHTGDANTLPDPASWNEPHRDKYYDYQPVKRGEYEHLQKREVVERNAHKSSENVYKQDLNYHAEPEYGDLMLTKRSMSKSTDEKDENVHKLHDGNGLLFEEDVDYNSDYDPSFGVPDYNDHYGDVFGGDVEYSDHFQEILGTDLDYTSERNMDKNYNALDEIASLNHYIFEELQQQLLENSNVPLVAVDKDTYDVFHAVRTQYSNPELNAVYVLYSLVSFVIDEEDEDLKINKGLIEKENIHNDSSARSGNNYFTPKLTALYTLYSLVSFVLDLEQEMMEHLAGTSVEGSSLYRDTDHETKYNEETVVTSTTTDTSQGLFREKDLMLGALVSSTMSTSDSSEALHSSALSGIESSYAYAENSDPQHQTAASVLKSPSIRQVTENKEGEDVSEVDSSLYNFETADEDSITSSRTKRHGSTSSHTDESVQLTSTSATIEYFKNWTWQIYLAIAGGIGGAVLLILFITVCGTKFLQWLKIKKNKKLQAAKPPPSI